MQTNTYLKPLVMFDPRKNLLVNEGFSLTGGSSATDTLGDLEAVQDEPAQADPNFGKVFVKVKTPGPVFSGLTLLNSEGGKKMMAVSRTGHIGFYSISDKKPALIFSGQIGGELSRSPVQYEKTIFVTTREGKVVAFKDEPGPKGELQILWERVLPKGILADPVIYGNTLIVPSLGGLHGFADITIKNGGRQVYLQQLNGLAGTPHAVGGNLFTGSEEKAVFSFEIGTELLSQRWKFPVKSPVRMKPFVSEKNNYVIFGSQDGSVYCIDRYEANPRWHLFLNAAVYSSIVLTENQTLEYYLFGADNGFFYCIDTFGKKVWSYRTGGKIRTEALLENGRVYFGSGDNSLYALDALTGKLIFRVQTDGPVAGKPIIFENSLYFASADACIYGVTL